MEEVRILLDIALIILFAKIFGEIAERFKVSHIVGEILAGLLVGPVLHWIAPSSFSFLSMFSMVGVVLLLFLIGLSTKFEEIKGDVYSASALAGIACGVSLLAGWIIGELVFNSFEIGLVIGVVLMGTSTAIPIKVLIDAGEFQTRVGKFLLTLSMADDVITLIGLATLSTFFAFGAVQIWQIITLIFTVIGFILVALTIGEKVSNRVLSVVQRMHDDQILIAIPLIIIFLFAFVSQRIGIATVTGAFLAGMAMSKSVFAEPVIAPKIKTIGYGFFIPIFFAYSALIIDLNLLVSYWWLVLTLLIVGATTKALSIWWFSRFAGFRGRDQGILAIGMIPRGEYGIVIAQLSIIFGVITNQIYGAIIGFVLATAIITPILFKLYIFRKGYARP